VAAELHHQPNAVFALRREGDGAAAMEDLSVAQGTTLNPKLICRD